MSITLIVLIVEVIIVLLGIVCLLFFLRWKRKKNKIVQVDQLLDNINNKEEERKAILARHLVKGYALGDKSAKELGSKMVDAEKQFLQQFVKQQIEQTSLTGFYETLCELLDQYLDCIPVANTAKDLAAVSNEQQSESDSEIEILQTQGKENDVQHVDAEPEPEPKVDIESTNNEDTTEVLEAEIAEQTETDEPDWGDAFSESGDEMDTDVKAGFESSAEVEGAISEAEEEPDWGDAFAEAGDEIDESTKAGYESEVKKDS